MKCSIPLPQKLYWDKVTLLLMTYTATNSSGKDNFKISLSHIYKTGEYTLYLRTGYEHVAKRTDTKNKLILVIKE